MTLNHLDAEELLHLALRDIRSGHHDNATTKLKEAAALDNGNSRIHFLLAAEYAEIGLDDRAIAGMQCSLQLDPSLHIARFQLGLLHFSQSCLADAREAWAPLDQLAHNNVYRLFKVALLTMNEGRDAAAIPILEQALHSEPDNEALRREITKVLEAARSRISTQPESTESAQITSHTFLHRYGDTVQDS